MNQDSVPPLLEAVLALSVQDYLRFKRLLDAFIDSDGTSTIRED